MGFNISSDELKSFHSIDRELYFRFLIDLRRDSAQAMRVMAFWFWLERVGYPCIVLILRSLPDHTLNAVFDRSVKCLAFMESDSMPKNYSLTNGDIFLKFLHESRASALHGISKTVTDVFSRAFDDIVKQARNLEKTTDFSVLKKEFEPIVERKGPGLPKVPITPLVPNRSHPLCKLRGYRPQVYYPELNAAKHQLDDRKLSSEASNLKGQFQNQDEDVSLEDSRAMFMTFSAGYPISKEELRTYLFRSYGDVIEAIDMQKTPPCFQPIYARVMFRSLSTVDTILNGLQIVKFVINGKEVWARRYVPRRKEKEVWVPKHY